jgi:NADPH:quinone reductase-like Zn-dependent oxidoreductase
MKQARFEALGPPHEVVRCVDVPDPGEPGPGEALVRIEAFPINPVDLLTIAGRYAHRPTLPATTGSEGAGRVDLGGRRIIKKAVDDRVMLLGRDNWSELRRVPAAQLVPVPGDADPLQLAMLKVNPATALLMLREPVALERGEWVIQDAANSAVGQHVIALARARGLRTVNVVRRASLAAELTAKGADAVLVDGPDLAARVGEVVGEAPPRLAIDALAGDICTRLGDCLGEGGVIVNYGLLSGRPCELRADQTVFKGVSLTGFWLVRRLGRMTREEVVVLYSELAARVATGELGVAVEATYPMTEIRAALEHAAREGRAGKILVKP